MPRLSRAAPVAALAVALALLIAGCPSDTSIEQAAATIASSVTQDTGSTTDQSQSQSQITEQTTGQSLGQSTVSTSTPSGSTSTGSQGMTQATSTFASTAAVDPGVERNTYLVLGRTITAEEMSEVEFSDEVRVPADDAENFGEPAEMFDAIPYEDIDVPDDDILNDLEDPGNGLIHAVGGLAGRFLNDIPDSTSAQSPGVFRGQWFGPTGEVRGVVRGEYRPLREVTPPPGIRRVGLLHGKYIDSEGRFRGLIRGRYGILASGQGFFFGRWLDRHERLLGVLRGRWDDSTDFNGGWFRGRWVAFNLCDESESLPDIPDAELDPLLVADIEDLTVLDEPATQAELAVLRAKSDQEADAIPVDGELDNEAGQPPCIDPDAHYGFLRGWHQPLPSGDPNDPNDPGRRHGFFHGRWHDAHGRPAGHLEGHWAERADLGDEDGPDHPQVRGAFHGRYVSMSGEIHGFIHGVYGRSANGLRVFRGRYYDPDGEPIGVIGGRWTNAPDRRGGPFFGMWIGVDFGDPPDGP